MRPRFVCFAAMAALVGCVSPPNKLGGPVPTVPVVLTVADNETIKAGVTRSLKDPTSALFPRPFVAFREASGTTWVCGYVNGRNSFGGYVGDKPFIGGLSNGSFAVVGMGGTDIQTSVVHQACAKYGIFI